MPSKQVYHHIRDLLWGMDIPWYKEGNVDVPSYMDGLRPVIFKLERIWQVDAKIATFSVEENSRITGVCLCVPIEVDKKR